MGGSGKGGAESNSQLQSSQIGEANALTGLLNQQSTNSNSLFNLAFPGQQVAENAAETLASGDPYAISRLISPQTQQITQAATGAKQNIINNAPAGGEKNLALENVDVQQGGQVGALATQGVNNAYNSLAQLGQSGIGQSQNAASTAISAGSSAAGIYGNAIQENIQQKGATLGAFGALGGDIAGLGGSIFGAAGDAGGFGKLFASFA
jgi:hypothetical protein